MSIDYQNMFAIVMHFLLWHSRVRRGFYPAPRDEIIPDDEDDLDLRHFRDYDFTEVGFAFCIIWFDVDGETFCIKFEEGKLFKLNQVVYDDDRLSCRNIQGSDYRFVSLEAFKTYFMKKFY